MNLLADANGARVYHADWRVLTAEVGIVDTLIVDAPYSEKTHAGHDDGAEDANRKIDYRSRVARPSGSTGPRRAISYRPFTPDDVRDFAVVWHRLTRGWFVSITDHVLAPVWADALESVGRYVFAPLPYVAPGSRVRLTGDGPSAWTCWIIVARPKSCAYSTWGTLPGAYVLPPGCAERMSVVGGKPSWLMERLAEDYSRPGDLVCDPCCGAGTTLVGAIRTGRRAAGGDIDRAHAELAAARIREERQALLLPAATPTVQGSLL